MRQAYALDRVLGRHGGVQTLFRKSEESTRLVAASDQREGASVGTVIFFRSALKSVRPNAEMHLLAFLVLGAPASALDEP